MGLSQLTIRDFRVHRQFSLPFKEGITVITGPNGAGKTSILEAISILASARSFRSGKNVDFIRKGSQKSLLQAVVTDESLENTLGIEIEDKRKRVTLNYKAIQQRRRLLEILPFIIFSPGDHRIIEGDASERRNFLNRAISTVNHGYADLQRKFQKTLFQRNQLLKRLQPQVMRAFQLDDEFSPWDTQFIHYSKQLIEYRKNYLHKLKPIFCEQYQKMAKNEDEIGLIYQPLGQENILENIHNIDEMLASSLKELRTKDILRGSTSLGPHRDEISLTLNGNGAKFYASQGEKRTLALALRLAEVALYTEKHGRRPILLIDDVSSELDRSRRQALVELLKQEQSQVLITATELPVDLLEDVSHPFDHWNLADLGEQTL